MPDDLRSRFSDGGPIDRTAYRDLRGEPGRVAGRSAATARDQRQRDDSCVRAASGMKHLLSKGPLPPSRRRRCRRGRPSSQSAEALSHKSQLITGQS